MIARNAVRTTSTVTNAAEQMDRLEEEEEAARLAREKQLRSSQRLQVTGGRRSRLKWSGFGDAAVVGGGVCRKFLLVQGR